MNILQELTVNTIYFMGCSFILGSLFTLLLLLLLDFMRFQRESKEDGHE
jgi:hypothetical protein